MVWGGFGEPPPPPGPPHLQEAGVDGTRVEHADVDALRPPLHREGRRKLRERRLRRAVTHREGGWHHRRGAGREHCGGGGREVSGGTGDPCWWETVCLPPTHTHTPIRVAVHCCSGKDGVLVGSLWHH